MRPAVLPTIYSQVSTRMCELSRTMILGGRTCILSSALGLPLAVSPPFSTSPSSLLHALLSRSVRVSSASGHSLLEQVPPPLLQTSASVDAGLPACPTVHLRFVIGLRVSPRSSVGSRDPCYKAQRHDCWVTCLQRAELASCVTTRSFFHIVHR